MKTYRFDIDVLPEHLDDLDHVNNVQYLEWVQRISREHWQILTRPQWDSQYAWVVRSHHITYHHPAVLGDKLTVVTHVKTARGAQSERHVEITLEGTETLVASCVTHWVLLDAQSGKPSRVPEEMIRALE